MKTIHMVGNAHIDPVWLWRWQEGFQEVKATFRSALDRMNEEPDFKFSATSVAFYEWIKKNNSGMFKEIQERVKEGRWEIIGGWYVEADCNLADGESYVRQALYGQRFLKENFGKITKIGCNPDTFGHNGMLPQILLKSGLESYLFMRPERHEGLKDLKGRNFLWKSEDGSSVLGYRIPEPYAIRSEELGDRTEKAVTELKISETKNIMLLYGVGNHGGGPTKQIIKEIKSIKNKHEDVQIIMSTAKEYINSLREDIPSLETIFGELQFHANGCYSVNPTLKDYNVKAEQALMTAEKFSTITTFTQKDNLPTKSFKQAWKNVLFNQFHDVITGASIKSACEDAIFHYGESISIAQRHLNNALQSISWDINIPEDLTMIPIVIFNPHSWGGLKTIEFESGYIENESYMLDSSGKKIPMQLVQPEVTAIATTKRQKITFVADVPPLGYEVYRVFRKDEREPELMQPSFKPVDTDIFKLENNYIKVEFNQKSGNIKSIFDKANNFFVINKEAAKCIVFSDETDTWGHGVDTFKDNISEAYLDKIQLIEFGDVRQIVRVTKRYKSSSIIMDFILYNDLQYIMVKTKIEWRENQKGLKIQFPLNLKSKTSTFSIPYGVIRRENNGVEVPSLGWVDYTEENSEYGLSIISNSKNSFDVEGSVISLTVLRNPIYAHLDIKGTRNEYKLDADLNYEYTGHGIHEFEYAIYPHKGDWNKSNVVKLGLELKQKTIGITETFHKGSSEQKESYINIDSENIILTTLKHGEDDGTVIARFREINGSSSNAKIRFNFLERDLNLIFKKYEIKTIKINLFSHEIMEVNLLEW